MTIVYYSPHYRAVLIPEKAPSFPQQPDFDDTLLPVETIEIDELDVWSLKFYPKDDVHVPLQFTHPDDFLQTSDKLTKFFEALPDNVFRINFKNYVGLSRFAGFQIKVINKKISETQFNVMLNELCDEFANLVFSFQQTVGGSGYKSESGNDPLYLQILFIRHFLLKSSPDLQLISELICRNPHYRLQAIRQTTPVELARQIDMASIVSVFSNPAGLAELPGNHPLVNTALARCTYKSIGRYLFPLQLVESHRQVEHDTPENRFVKFFIGDLLNRLRQYNDNAKNSFLNPELRDDLKLLIQELEHFSQNPLWQTVGKLRHIPSQSTVLQKREGYRQLFKLYSLLQLTTRHTYNNWSFDELIELKNVPLLYEYWCFFQVKRALESVLACQPQVINGSNNQEESILDDELTLDYGDNISLCYDKTCRGQKWPTINRLCSYSLNLRPDIMICQGSRKLILDAKYKGFFDSENQGLDKPNKEDIKRMHSYRDAINDVWGAYALYPGKVDEIYPYFDEADDSYKGVGALSLVPGGKQGILFELIQAFLA